MYYDDDIADLAWEAGPTGFCKCCGEKCTGITVDFGIGPYEYGSIRSVDVRLEMVSDCCEDEIVDDIEDVDEHSETCPCERCNG